MKLFLASFFLFIFSFQVLPVKAIGKLLFKQAMTEEIHETECEGDTDGPECEVKKQDDPYSPSSYLDASEKLIAKYVSNVLGIMPDNVSKQYIPDILTPPPNGQ